jgi:hypothetical protein
VKTCLYDSCAGNDESVDAEESASTLKTSVSPPATTVNVPFVNGNPKLPDVYVNCHAFSIRAGAFKIPFSLKNPYRAYTCEMVDNSMVI